MCASRRNVATLQNLLFSDPILPLDFNLSSGSTFIFLSARSVASVES